MNNVDIAISKVRELQAFIFDKNSSPQSLFEKSQEVVNAVYAEYCNACGILLYGNVQRVK